MPRDAAAGTYSGALRVVPEGLPAREVPFVLEVLPFELPAVRSLYAWVPLYATRLVRRRAS